MGYTGGARGIRTPEPITKSAHKISSLGRYDRFGIAPYLTAVFGGNGKTQIYSGGVSSILDSLTTIIGNILRFRRLMLFFQLSPSQPVDGIEP